MFVKMRNVDANNDWCFGKNLQDYGDDLVSTSNNIKTRLQSVKYDCFFDLTAGIDWFNILGNRGQFAKNVVEINVRLCILQSLYVTEIVNLQVIERNNRSLYLQYTVNTIFGQVTDNTVIGG